MPAIVLPEPPLAISLIPPRPVTHSFKPFDEDAIRRGACKEPETASLYLVYAEQTVESPAALQYVSESETARSADLFNSTSKILITNVPHKDVLFKLLPPVDDPPDSSTPAPSAAPAGNANRAGGQPSPYVPLAQTRQGLRTTHVRTPRSTTGWRPTSTRT